ncbi:MAG: hypothetical protein JXR91_06880 [Deltaproteobacteria bacterium]|nr:hypothetical protein [Deltaproteobacteria bacterium]
MQKKLKLKILFYITLPALLITVISFIHCKQCNALSSDSYNNNNERGYTKGYTSFDECLMEEPYGDPLPSTPLTDIVDPFIPDAKELKTIERLAKGIHTWKTTRENGGWWECGTFIPAGRQTEDKAIILAYNLVKAAAKYSDDKYKVNVWGLAGTMSNESSFDRCAVGYHFRKWAIDKNLIQQRKRTISYGENELMNAMTSPRARGWFKTTGVDVGYCQLLTRFYDGEIIDMMQESTGVDICAQQFRYRSEVLHTKRPWKWWRGFKAKWYDDRVTRRALEFGAVEDEI